MEIYLDIVICMNFLFDFILLSSVNFILRRNTSLIKIILGSLFGEITIIMLFFDISRYLFIYKILVSMIMIIITFGYKDIRYMIKNISYFYLVSMLLGGGIYFLENQFSYSNNGLVFHKHNISYCYLIIIMLGIFIFIKYIKSFRELDSHYNNYYICKIYFDNNNVLKINAFLDTGNKLKDPYTNKSIILIDKNKVSGINLYNPIYVPYNSLNNRGLLECYKALKIEIDGKYCDKFLVGLSNDNFFIDGISCIINSKIMEGLR